MIVSVHQPNYLPYLGFFDKMMKADIFVIYDDAQFSKGDYHHRNKIRIHNGWKWLTVPVEKKRVPINEIRIKNEVTHLKGIEWTDVHLRIINDNYENSTYYGDYLKKIKNIYEKKFDMLFDLNLSLIMLLKKAFNINTKIEFSSKLIDSGKVNPESMSSERLLEIVEAVGGDIYLSGHMGRDYLNNSLFKENRINIEFQDYKHPFYEQQYSDFIPNMSAIDALFNVGGMPK